MTVSLGARMTRPTASTGRGTCKDDDDAVKLPRPFYPVLIETHSETAVTADGSGGRASGSHTRIYTRWRAHMHARTRAHDKECSSVPSLSLERKFFLLPLFPQSG